jgi:hypothetical protein
MRDERREDMLMNEGSSIGDRLMQRSTSGLVVYCLLLCDAVLSGCIVGFASSFRF